MRSPPTKDESMALELLGDTVGGRNWTQNLWHLSAAYFALEAVWNEAGSTRSKWRRCVCYWRSLGLFGSRFLHSGWDSADIVSEEALSSYTICNGCAGQKAWWFPIAGLSENWQDQNVVWGSPGSHSLKRHSLEQEPAWRITLAVSPGKSTWALRSPDNCHNGSRAIFIF